MEVRFTPEQEAQLGELAGQSRTDTEQLVKRAALRMVEEDQQFRASIRRSIDEVNRVDSQQSHDDVALRVERLLLAAMVR